MKSSANRRRIQNARDILKHQKGEWECSDEFAIIDILSNLMHFCKQKTKPEFANCLRIATSHYNLEK